jgi:hypothetical protein
MQRASTSRSPSRMSTSINTDRTKTGDVRDKMTNPPPWRGRIAVSQAGSGGIWIPTPPETGFLSRGCPTTLPEKPERDDGKLPMERWHGSHGAACWITKRMSVSVKRLGANRWPRSVCPDAWPSRCCTNNPFRIFEPPFDEMPCEGPTCVVSVLFLWYFHLAFSWSP